MEFGDLDGGREATELVAPVAHDRLGHDDQVRALDAARLVQVADQRDGLEGLAEALESERWNG